MQSAVTLHRTSPIHCQLTGRFVFVWCDLRPGDLGRQGQDHRDVLPRLLHAVCGRSAGDQTDGHQT